MTRAGKRAYDLQVAALRAVLDGTDDSAQIDAEPEHQHEGVRPG